jgi:hypothetical protein
MGKKILIFVSVYLILLCSWLLWSMQPVEANEHAWFIQLDEVSVDWMHYHPYSRSPYFYDSQMKDGIAIHMNSDMLFDYLYWDNTVHTDTDDTQFHTVGWKFELGAHVTSFLNLYYHHHSQHIMDGQLPYMKFPSEDSYGITINIYNARPRGNSIMGI